MFHNTATPIKHIVVIFQENVSFDHYFGTYPNAANTSGQTFHGLGQLKTQLEAAKLEAARPLTASRKALQRRYFRLAVEVTETLARVPSGAGKRLRGRIAAAAEGFAELRAIVAEMKAAGRM